MKPPRIASKDGTIAELRQELAASNVEKADLMGENVELKEEKKKIVSTIDRKKSVWKS